MNGEDRVSISHRLSEKGGEVSIYLYNGQTLAVRDVPKEESAENEQISKNMNETGEL